MANPETETSDEFDALIAQALTELPAEFAAQLHTVAIVVDEEATAEQLASTGTTGMFGLYQGVPRTAFGASGAPVPSKITIFRRPIERFYRHPLARAQAVRETLFHEIAHHFGISDARLSELSRARHQR